MNSKLFYPGNSGKKVLKWINLILFTEKGHVAHKAKKQGGKISTL